MILPGALGARQDAPADWPDPASRRDETRDTEAPQLKSWDVTVTFSLTFKATLDAPTGTDAVTFLSDVVRRHVRGRPFVTEHLTGMIRTDAGATTTPPRGAGHDPA